MSRQGEPPGKRDEAFVGLAFLQPQLPVTPWRVVSWWELRRIAFNGIVGVYGLICLVVFLWAITTSGHLERGEDAIEPLAILAAPFGINLLYTLGWLVEVPARFVVPDLTPAFAPSLLKAGLVFGIVLITLPADYWLVYRVLQLADLVG